MDLESILRDGRKRFGAMVAVLRLEPPELSQLHDAILHSEH